jgi:N6-adenosine-specific RNA methylase IME4
MNELRTRSWDDLPLNSYQIVYADPPWDYYGDPNKSQAAGKHYSLMTLEELSALPVASIMAKRSILLLWATCPKLDVAIDLIRAWKLTYRGVFHNWVKTTKAGKIITGQGARPSFTKPTSELLLVASTVPKGRPLQILDEGMAQVVPAPRPGNIHSRKPSVCRTNIDDLYGPDVRKIELFARTAHPGWDAWGNQVPIEGEDNEEGRLDGSAVGDSAETRDDAGECGVCDIDSGCSPPEPDDEV